LLSWTPRHAPAGGPSAAHCSCRPSRFPYVGRLYFRQTFGLGGEKETVESNDNQLAEARDIDRIAIVAGKMAFPDRVDRQG
jgi:hypothetical protein